MKRQRSTRDELAEVLDDPGLRSAEGTLAGAVSSTVAGLDLEPSDQAAARLALVYAEALDFGVDDLERVGPALLRCLEQLGATPMARAEIGKKVGGRGGDSQLDRLRASRRPS